MTARQPYSRVYWSIRDDQRLADIYGDDHALAAWLRSLIAADMAYPAPADLPRRCTPAAMRKLVTAGIVEPAGDGLFRFHGLAAERTRRRGGSGTGPGPDRNGSQPGPEPDPNGSLAYARAPRLGSSMSSEGGPGETADADPDPADAYWSLAGRYPTDRVIAWLDELTGEYGPMPVIRALAEEHQSDSTASTLIGRARDRLRRDGRALDKAARQEAQARLAARRSAGRERPEYAAVAAEMAKIMGPPA